MSELIITSSNSFEALMMKLLRKENIPVNIPVKRITSVQSYQTFNLKR